MEIKKTNEQGISYNKVRKLILVGVIISGITVIIWLFKLGYDAPRGQAVDQITKEMGLKNAAQQDLATIIAINFREYKRNTFWWNLAYDACIFLAAILSAFAGVILKLEYFSTNEKRNKDIAAILAASAAVLIGISSTGGFHEKWQANRLAAAKLENLAYDLLKNPISDDDRKRIISRLQEISLNRNKKISDEESYTQEQTAVSPKVLPN